MFKNVLVGVRGARSGQDAVALAEQLLARDGELTLAHVYSGDPRLRHGSGAEYETMEQRKALALLAEARDGVGVRAELRYVQSTSPGRGLHELAESTGADLLVVGSSRRGAMGRVLLGDDTREALGGAPCAVAIAPTGYAQTPVAIREIGVAYNGSPESEHAVTVARALAAEHGAHLSACEAVGLPVYTFVGGPVPIGDVAETLVERAQGRIAALGGVEPRAAFGNVVDQLTTYSASLDLLVVGSRGYGPVGRLVHGSTSSQLARAARCPLLVLTRAARTEQPQSPSQAAPDTTRYARST